MFDRRAVFTVSTEATDEESLFDVILEAGAEDVAQNREHFEVTSAPESFTAITEALQAAKITADSAEIMRVPQNTVDLDAKGGRRILRLLEALEDSDDVQSVSSNFEIDDILFEKLVG